MFDFVGVCDYHGDDDDYSEGGVVVAKAPRKRYEPRRLLSLDVDDHIDPTTREWVTVDENGNMVFPEASEQMANELGTKFEAWLLSRLDKGDINPGEESWLRMIGSHFRANPDQYSGGDPEFMVEQFAFHPFQQLGGMQQAVRVFGDATRLQAVIDDMNEAMFLPPADGTAGVHSPKAKPSNNQPHGDTMNNEQPHDPSLDFASGPQQFNPGTNNAALALALTNPGIRVNGASTDVLPKVGREMRRRNIESDYETRMRQVLGDSLTRIYTHNDGVLLHFRDKGQIQDLGSRVIAQGGMEERLAAERIVAMGLERKWPNITFTGSPVFIEHAMRAALKARLKVVAKGDDQADILAKVMAEQRGSMGAMGGAASQPLPPGAVAGDDDVLLILSELDGLPPSQKLGAPAQSVAPKPTASTPLPQAPAPVAPTTAPAKPVVGVFPPHINFKERLQARREQRQQSNQPVIGPKVSRPAPPRP